MKKIYIAAAIAMAFGASAAAANLQYKGDVKQALQSTPQFAVAEEEGNGMHKAVAEGLQQGVNMYSWTYYTAYSTADGQKVEEWVTESVEVELQGTKAIISGFFDLASVIGTYDSANKTITIKSQDLFYTYSTGENFRLYCWNYVPSPSDPSKQIRQEGDIVLKYTPQGSTLTMNSTGETYQWGVGGFSSETNVAMWISLPSIVGDNRGYTFAEMCFFGDVPSSWGEANEQFVYNASEWKDLGNAKFHDGWMQPMFTGEIPEYEVKCQQNIKNPNRILLVDPYNTGFFAELGLPANSGFIQLDITNPECVLVVPFTNAGLQMANIVRGVPEGVYFSMTNAEGMKIMVDGFSYEEVIEEAEDFGDELPTLVNGVITIPQCRLQVPNALGAGNVWSQIYGGAFDDEDDPIDDDLMHATITIPALAGVEGIIADAENAPARYFNLQGMEVANPEAGQLVIKKEGSKTTKMVVR
jgi:hypothetical protein